MKLSQINLTLINRKNDKGEKVGNKTIQTTERQFGISKDFKQPILSRRSSSKVSVEYQDFKEFTKMNQYSRKSLEGKTIKVVFKKDEEFNDTITDK